jgi:parallel beta-helix repeat protein
LKKSLSVIFLAFLLLSMLTLTFDIQPARAEGAIYIRLDGSVEGTDRIYHLGDLYSLTGNIYDSIVVEKSNIVIDGNGYALQGNGSGWGVYLNGTTSGITNVTVQNTHVKNFFYGIMLLNASNYNNFAENIITNNNYGLGLDSSSYNIISNNTIKANSNTGIYLFDASDYNSISGNTVTNNVYGIALGSSSHNSISNNTIKANSETGIYLWVASNYNSISGNTVTNNMYGIRLWSSSNNNSISNNTITNNDTGIRLYSSSNNIINENIIMYGDIGIGVGACSYHTISENIIAHNNYGLRFYSSSNHNSMSVNTIIANSMYGVWFDITCSSNTLHHNDLIDNGIPAYSTASINIWDNGYPSGGNYWSSYVGSDLFSGASQNLPGSDGIGDTSYIIDSDNKDRYPLMNPERVFDIAITEITVSKTVIGQRYTATITVTVENKGNQDTVFTVHLMANATVIQTLTINLTSGTSTALTIVWNPVTWTRGAYQISAQANRLPGETDMQAQDDLLAFGKVKVTVPGDVDGDRDVDIYDIVKLASVYGAGIGQSGYFANGDIDGNGMINIYDVVIASSRYGYRES